MDAAQRDPVPDWLLTSLNAIDGVTARAGMRVGELKISVDAAPPVTFSVETKARVSIENIERLIQFLQTSSHRPRTALPLLATWRVPATARRTLRKAKLSWVERDTGVQYLLGPGLLVDRTAPEEERLGRQRDEVHRRPVLLRGRTGVLAEMLLSAPAGTAFQVGILAEKAGASPGLASRVLHRLEKERLVKAEGTGPHKRWRVVDAPALLDLWVAEEREAELKTSLYLLGRSAYDRYERLARLTAAGVTWALGGVAAANLYAPTLTVIPEPDVWVQFDAAPKDLAAALGAEIVPTGANAYLWRTEGDPALHGAVRGAAYARLVSDKRVSHVLSQLSLVSPARACVEATRAGGRGEEVARNLRQEVFAIPETGARPDHA